MRIDIVRDIHTKMKVKKRIEANRIVGVIGFRDHFSSHPGRHSWDLCGHPVYWWALKTMAEVKYIEKILLWTEVEQAWEDARKISDKFVIWKRPVEECVEPTWYFADDLKTLKSRVTIYENWTFRKEEIKNLLGFEPTVKLIIGANRPLVRAKSVNRLIERYFEDDIAEMAMLVTKNRHPCFHMRHPDYPQYTIPMFEFSNYNTRQEYPSFYICCGAGLVSLSKVNTSRRATYIEVGREEEVDIHDEGDLELARFYMEKRLKENGRE